MEIECRKTKLLLVDDESDFLDATASALRRRGFDVTIVSKSTIALKVIELEEHDVAILDVKMPDLPGDQLLRQIRQQWSNIPVIILTGHGTSQLASETLRDGAFAYLTKPCSMSKLAKVASDAAQSCRPPMSDRSLVDAGRKHNRKEMTQEKNMTKKREKIRLILVDDEVEFLNSTTKALTRRDFEVRAVQNGTIALKFLEEEVFDVAVLDIKMPGITGDDLFREIKKHWPDMPVVMLTGHGTIDQAFQTSRQGVFDYLTKPCEVEQLAQVARNAVAEQKRAGISEAELRENEEIRVLLVDDEEELLDSLSSALRRRGLYVVTAQSGAQAIEQMDMRIFHVVVLDIKMPGVNGIELLHSVKQSQPSAEVILLTGHPSINTVTQGMKDGAFDYLLKPHDTDELVTKIRKAFLRSRTQAEEAKEKEIKGILERNQD